MSPAGARSAPEPFRATLVEFGGPRMSWVCEHPLPPTQFPPWGLCWGSEDGVLYFSSIDSKVEIAPFRAVVSGEAVNGIAFTDTVFAVSTRQEVVLWHPPPAENLPPSTWVYEGGAHGVVRTSSGGFLSPLGPAGLLWISKNREGNYYSRDIAPVGAEVYFYKSAFLGVLLGRDCYACAGRSQGLVALLLDESNDSASFLTMGAPGRDVVDVCALNVPDHPFAVAFLGQDCSIGLSSHVIDDRTPITLRMSQLDGTPYSIISAHGHLFILTSAGFHVCRDFVTRFSKGDSFNGRSRVDVVKEQFSDMLMIYDTWLVLFSEQPAIVAIGDLVARKAGRTVTRSGKRNQLSAMSYGIGRVSYAVESSQPETLIEGHESITSDKSVLSFDGT